MSDEVITLGPVTRLSRDLKKASITLGIDEVRFLVDRYYEMQERRIASAAQVRALDSTHEPHEILTWFGEQADSLEGQVLRALKEYASSRPVGEWLMSLYGIGPVISAGLLAHIDITKVSSAGAIHRFAGLDPTSKWEKGKKRPWNASLKRLCWLIGKSFEKFKNRDECVYGKLLLARLDYENAKNERLEYKAEADKALATDKNWRKEIREIYESGKLPPSHINARARRWTVKLFLSHLFEVLWHYEYSAEVPKPYVIGILGHIDYIPVPNDPRTAENRGKSAK